MDDIDDTIEIALDNLPQEAKDFLYGEGFKSAIDTVVKDFSLTDAQKSDLDFHLTRVIALVESRDELLHLCDEWHFTAPQKKKFVDDIERIVFTPLVEATNYIVEDEEGSTETQTLPSNTLPDVLASLTERLKQTSTVAPITRQVTAEAVVEKPAAKMFDPYRETPEK